jgi:hypothetical protein
MKSKRIIMVCGLLGFLLAACTQSTALQPMDREPIFGVNDDSSWDAPSEQFETSSSTIKSLGLQAVRRGIGCGYGFEVGRTCDFTNSDRAVEKYLAKGLRVHAIIPFRWEINMGDPLDSTRETWIKNFGEKCRQTAAHYKGKINYYIIDNETDVDYRNDVTKIDDARQPIEAPLVVKMHRACYEAVKKIDANIRIESTPAQRPNTTYNRELLEAGIGNYADVIGTHFYGGQIEQNSIAELKSYMKEFGVDKPIAVSEAGVNPNWYTPTGPFGDIKWKGLEGKAARAQWIKDAAEYAKTEKLESVLFFTMFFGIPDDDDEPWNMHNDQLALDALRAVTKTK